MPDSFDIQRFFRAVPGLFLVLRPDAAFTIAACSEGFLETMQADETIFGRPLFELFTGNPAHAGAVDGDRHLRASLHQVLETRRPHTMDVQRYDVRRPPERGGGFEARYWLPVNAPVLSADGEVDYIIHRMDDAAAKANREAVTILESITEGFFTLDREWRFDYVNQEAHRILDRAPGELAGRVLWQTYPGLEDTVFEVNYRHSMVMRERRTFTAHYAPHGRWYEVISAPAAEGVSVYFRDVTEQKRLEAERDLLLAESERQRRIFETALDSTPDFVYVFDLQHRVLYANAPQIQAWGVDDPYGKGWAALGYAPAQADRHDAELGQVIATGITFRGEMPSHGPRGTRLYEYIFAPVLGAFGEVVAVAGTTRDITRREQQARQRAESHRLEAIGTLAGGVAHDFNNMLAAILGNVALAKDDMAPHSPAMDRLQLVHRAAERARSLVRQILTFTRRSSQERSVLSLQPLIDEAVAMLKSTLPPDVLLSVQPAPHALWACVDAAQFQQVVVNLCTNASQALGAAGGEVRVSLDRASLVPEAGPTGASGTDAETDAPADADAHAGDWLRLQVEDNGHGMDDALRRRIFEPYFTTKPVGHGTGLGLAVVHGIVSEAGGTIRVDSERGRGTSVAVYLPAVCEPVELPAAEASAPLPRVDSHGERVLYVDDDEVVSLTAAALLSHAGYRVTCASDGPGALAALRGAREAFAVVVTDFSMPGMTGLDVARAVATEAPGAAVLIISGLVTDELRQTARRLAVDDVLPKEEMLERLVLAVRTSIAARGDRRVVESASWQAR